MRSRSPRIAPTFRISTAVAYSLNRNALWISRLPATYGSPCFNGLLAPSPPSHRQHHHNNVTHHLSFLHILSLFVAFTHADFVTVLSLLAFNDFYGPLLPTSCHIGIRNSSCIFLGNWTCSIITHSSLRHLLATSRSSLLSAGILCSVPLLTPVVRDITVRMGDFLGRFLVYDLHTKQTLYTRYI